MTPERAAHATPRDRSSRLTLLFDNSQGPDEFCHLFEDPVSVIYCDDPADVEAALEAIDEARDRGLHVAGFLSYELGYLLEPRLAGLCPSERADPLIHMGLFRTRRDLSSRSVEAWLAERAQGGYTLDDVRLSTTEGAYRAAFDRARKYIAAGDIYQINLTFMQRFRISGNPLALYGELRQKQRMGFGAIILAPEFTVLSISPELFLECRSGRAITRPMKGTAARGRTVEEDAAIRAWLREDEKSRSENLMIVDLLRNDLGRVSRFGSVRVPALFEVESYPTLHQMTSTITAELRDGVGFRELVHALFPCGSITGAPRIRAMEIIRELEENPRGIYTGAIGFIEPSGDLTFNVGIRTLMLRADGTGEMGIGSGVVFDSNVTAEFEECLLKAEFLTRPYQPFELIETLRWQNGYFLLARHLHRLADSAAHFQYTYQREDVERALMDSAEAFDPTKVYRVRLLLDRDGRVRVTATEIELPTSTTRFRFAVSDKRVDSADVWLYHKTTRRSLYDTELNRLREDRGCDEVLFMNERDELTEGAYSNVFLERDGLLRTPPVSSGLLAGTFRQELLDDPERNVREAVLTRADLEAADTVWFGNSVRGLVRAEAANP